MSKLADMSKAEQKDIERRIAKGHGAILTVEWTDLDEENKPVSKTDEYYVGKMTVGQTGNILSILAAIFVNGSDAKERENRNDNIPFLEYLDEYHLSILVTVILGADRNWVVENWDAKWVMNVVGTFFKYNDFFALLNLLTDWMKANNMTETQAKDALIGKKA